MLHLPNLTEEQRNGSSKALKTILQ
ncbi:TPA: hypothetical protein ACF841_002297 [Staphylococcus aureus]